MALMKKFNDERSLCHQLKAKLVNLKTVRYTRNTLAGGSSTKSNPSVISLGSNINNDDSHPMTARTYESSAGKDNYKELIDHTNQEAC